MSQLVAKVTVSNATAVDRGLGFELVVTPEAMLSWISRERLKALAIEPIGRREFRRRDGAIVERDVAAVVIEIDERLGADTVVVAEPGDPELCGLHMLHAVGMTIEGGKLVPMKFAFALSA